MKKSIWIFLLAVLLPSAVLGWLALRSAEEQQIILEKRTAELYQAQTDEAASAARALIDDQRRAFNDTVQRLLGGKNAQAVANNFTAELAKEWPRKAIGFALGKEGQFCTLQPQRAAGNAEWGKFLLNNGGWLAGTTPATVYWVAPEDLSRPEQLRRNKDLNDSQNTIGNYVNLRGSNSYSGKVGARGQQRAVSPQMTKSASQPVPQTSLNNNGVAVEAKQSAAENAAGNLSLPVIEPTTGNGLLNAGQGVNANPGGTLQIDAVVISSGWGLGNGGLPANTIGQNDFANVGNQTVPAGGNLSTANTLNSGAFSLTDNNGYSVSNLTGAPLSGAPDNGQTANLNGGAYLVGPFAAKPATEPTKDSAPDPATQAEQAKLQTKWEAQPRQVEPQQVFTDNNGAISQLTPTTSDFRALTSDSNEGVITRFVQDQLNIIFWLRPPQAPDLIFGCLIEAESLRDLWPAALPVQERGSREKWSRTEQPEFVLALLDDKARPVATQPPGETGRDWKRPFVASEIGEALPHWELALYLQRPEQLRESARALRRTLSFLIVAALGAIACGGWLVVADARRQLARAQQKTDFVSNVSHELKTPLTSIRMFAELMQNGNGNTAKHPQYLRIIMVEAERLTRLINNVLDFAGLERKQKRIERKPLDLHAVIGRAWEGHALHLQESGFSTRWEAAPPPYPVVGDDDALAQILVNLLSNAEKYSGERKEVELHTYLDGEHVCVSVLDRGCGVPGSEERKIFEAFYRAHDSLSSGIQGSGLGLTLAQRLAHEHGGEITYQPRAGGGSNFTLRLPIVRET